MSDPELLNEVLANIMTAILRIERRFTGIETPDDFLFDHDGTESTPASLFALMDVMSNASSFRSDPASIQFAYDRMV